MSDLPTWMQWLGFTHRSETSITAKWGYFVPEFGFEFIYELDYEDCRPQISFCLIWGYFLIKLPHYGNPEFDFDKHENSRIGFKWYEDIFWIYPPHFLRDKSKHSSMTNSISFYLPWLHKNHDDKFHCVQNPRTLEWTPASSGRHFNNDYVNYTDLPENNEVHFFIGKDEHGNDQTRYVIVNKVRRRWKPKWFSWLPAKYFMYNYSLDFTFNDEVGKRSGSYKGGTMGMGIDISEHDTISDAFAKFQEEVLNGSRSI